MQAEDCMRRRAFLTSVMLPRMGLAQQPARLPRVAFLTFVDYVPGTVR
jgi:hypothetical protein